MHLKEVGANLDNMLDLEVDVTKVFLQLLYAGTDVANVMKMQTKPGTLSEGWSRHGGVNIGKP